MFVHLNLFVAEKFDSNIISRYFYARKVLDSFLKTNLIVRKVPDSHLKTNLIGPTTIINSFNCIIISKFFYNVIRKNCNIGVFINQTIPMIKRQPIYIFQKNSLSVREDTHKKWHGPLSHQCREGKTLVVRPLQKKCSDLIQAMKQIIHDKVK